jgi:hypothetical protein
MVDTNGNQKRQNNSDKLTFSHVFKKHLDIEAILGNALTFVYHAQNVVL